jgi:hypothetical protein
MVGVFPSVEGYLQLRISQLADYSEDRTNERSYIRENNSLDSLDRLHELTAQKAN